MVLRVLPCLLCAATLVAGVQDPSPAPQPPSAPGLPPPAVPSTQPAPSSGADLTALKAQLDDLQIRLRQQQEDGILRLGELKAAQAELRAALADLARQLALLEALPAQIKLIGDQAKAGADRGAALDLQQAAQLQARLEGERGALQALLIRLGQGLKATQAGPLAGLEQALAQLQEATALVSQPGFTALVATVKDKLAKGPLGAPLKDAATMNSFFANPVSGSNWMVAAVAYGPGWESDKLRNLDKALGAADAATRMAVDLKAARALLAGLKGEAAFLQISAEERLAQVQALLDPNGTPLDAEALAAKAPAAYKPLLDAIPAGLSAANRDTLVLLIATRNELQVLLLAQRLLLSRMLGAASSIAATFAPFRQEPALAALDALIKSAEESRAKLKTLLAAPEPRDLAILEAATYR